MSVERPTVVLEMRSGQQDIAETRQGAIGAGLEAAGVLPIYANVGNTDAFTPDGSAVQDFRVRDPDNPGRLIKPTDKDVVVPDAYRFRDVPTAERPAFAAQVSGYNSARLCDATLGRITMRHVLVSLGFRDHLPPSRLAEDGGAALDLSDMEGEMLFAKPGAAGAYSDVAGDSTDLARRSRYVKRSEILPLLSDPKFAGSVLLQPDIAVPTSEIVKRLNLNPKDIPDYEQRRHHTLRVYHMVGTGETPDVAEVRLMGLDDIGKPQPSHYELLEPEQLFAAVPEAESLHRDLSTQIGQEYGLNYIAADYFLAKDGKVMIDGVHVRPWLPSIQDDLSRRTVETEVRTLSRLVSQE